MCLSDAYEIKDGKQNLVCSRVCNVSADGENVTLTDLMGFLDGQSDPALVAARPAVQAYRQRYGV